MKKDLTELVLIIDRSGSMEGLQSDVEGGIKSLVEQQEKDKGETRITLVQFDSQYDIVYQNAPLSTVLDYKHIPRGSTALLDAVGVTIKSVGGRLANTPEDQRPENIVVAIHTDGYENASRQYSNEDIKEMIKHQEEKYNWHFIFMGAGMDAFVQAGQMGIRITNTARAIHGDMLGTYATTSSAVSNVKSFKNISGATGQSLQEQYDESGKESA